ncbi:hypothetical protein [Oerskovia flava]|uniref:hypothetical protein n=1 Tax=Oerskovia flava TaxID=2986422 RepID=UPI00223FDB0D|nr:hypothetical protein [Oerskovia sp. JB1-3-2]
MIAEVEGLIGMEVHPGCLTPSPDSLRERWRSLSIESVWLRPGDWYHPAVDALVEALADGRSPEPAAERLGSARGEAGVSVGETIDDVACLYRSTGADPALAVLRAVTTGWVLGNETAPIIASVDDPETGLATIPYLVRRLRETYGAAVRSGRSPARSHALVVVDVAVEHLTSWQRAARSAVMGETLTQTFGEGHPMSALGNGSFAILCERTDELDKVIAELRARTERNARALGVTTVLRRPPRIWVEPLPRTHDGALALISHLSR